MPDLIDELRSLALKIERSRDAVQTEEATKNAFIMPFISALGYDVFDPTEVTPELNADIGVKKHEKIDYAILQAGKPIMLFECKHHAEPLAFRHASQLYRYFSVTDCRVAVLTNGIEYRFYSDLEASNKMDDKPFLVFNILDFQDSTVNDIKKFTKEAFSIDALISTATELKYLRSMKSLFNEQLNTPTEKFVAFCMDGIGVERKTQALKEQFVNLAKQALSEFISERMDATIRRAIGSKVASEHSLEQASDVNSTEEATSDSGIETTMEELEGYYTVKAILRDLVDVKRITHRDGKSYMAILLDDNNRKPICRLRFNAQTVKYVGLFDSEKNEERVEIKCIDDIYAYAEQLRKSVEYYL